VTRLRGQVLISVVVVAVVLELGGEFGGTGRQYQAAWAIRLPMSIWTRTNGSSLSRTREGFLVMTTQPFSAP
jgi:hypothetical protein